MPFWLLFHSTLHRGSHNLLFLRALTAHPEWGVLRLAISCCSLRLLNILRQCWLVVSRTGVSDGFLVKLDAVTSRCPQAQRLVVLLETAVLPRVVHLPLQTWLLILRDKASKDTIRAARVYELTAYGVDARRIGPRPRVELHEPGLCGFVWLPVCCCVEGRLFVPSLLNNGLAEYVDVSTTSWAPYHPVAVQSVEFWVIHVVNVMVPCRFLRKYSSLFTLWRAAVSVLIACNRCLLRLLKSIWQAEGLRRKKVICRLL